MKAITRDRYGSPDVLRFEDLTPPAPAAGEILVEVGAAGVNRGDALFHVAQVARSDDYSVSLSELQQELEDDPLLEVDH